MQPLWTWDDRDERGEDKSLPESPSMEAGIASWRMYLEEDPVGSPSSVSPPSVVLTGGCDFPQLHPPGACSWVTHFKALGLSFFINKMGITKKLPASKSCPEDSQTSTYRTRPQPWNMEGLGRCWLSHRHLCCHLCLECGAQHGPCTLIGSEENPYCPTLCAPLPPWVASERTSSTKSRCSHHLPRRSGRIPAGSSYVSSACNQEALSLSAGSLFSPALQQPRLPIQQFVPDAGQFA